jgi:hypothetical protein
VGAPCGADSTRTTIPKLAGGLVLPLPLALGCGDDGDDAAGGRSWVAAKATVQVGLDLAAVDEVNAFTEARISACFNVTQAEPEDEAYFNGDSQELAARDLFGDDALFFPAETLSVSGSTGLRLDRIDDILLRLDYVSVARGR